MIEYLSGIMKIIMNGAKERIHFISVDHEFGKRLEADVIVETPVSLTINGEIWLTLMCTPTDLEALAVGFLFNEHVIQDLQELASVRICPSGDNIDIWLTHAAEKPRAWRRTSGCTGGVTSVEENPPASPAQKNGILVPVVQIGKLIGALFEAQDLYRASGGVHTSALSDGRSILVSAEDVGRHNTLDKIAGLCLLKNIPTEHSILLTTGRISSEMLQKAIRIGAALAISRTSPTSLSIQMADRLGITLIGYAHRNSFRIYTHHERILFPADPPLSTLEQDSSLYEAS
jgi:FdhD protein